MSSVQQQILEWSKSLPYWERAALQLVMSGNASTDADEEKLLQLLLEDAGLAPLGVRPALKAPVASGKGEINPTRTKLVKAYDFKFVNALVEGQELEFSSGLTVFYGGNGSGKSGYARVLGSLGYSRGDTSVLPDISKPYDPDAVAEVLVDIDDGAPHELRHVVGETCPQLGSLYAFDTTSVDAHLAAPHVLSFAPAGLSVLTELAELTDRVRQRLQSRIAGIPQQFAVSPLFAGDSQGVRALRTAVDAKGVEALRALSELTSVEEVRLAAVDVEIAKMKATDPAIRISALQARSSLLDGMIAELKVVATTLDGMATQDCRSIFVEIESLRRTVKELGVAQFKNARLAGVGTDAWTRFVRAARAVADIEERRGAPYPGDADVCLLCQQPLSDEARTLLSKLWLYLRGEAQERLAAAELKQSSMVRSLKSLPQRFQKIRTSLDATMAELPKNCVDAVSAFLVAAESGRSARENLLAGGGALPNLNALGTPEKLIDGQAALLRQEIAGLVGQDRAAKMRSLAQEQLELSHRKLLKSVLPQVEEFVRQRAWAQQAARSGGSTRHITTKYGDIFADRVTTRYVSLFKDELTELGCPMVVEVETHGRKGETRKRLVLRSHQSVPAEIASPALILSEGERRAIALADFLTEVSLDEESGTIVLDDPVTSLDVRWKGAVAPRLAREAQARQVIIFTHDMHFLYLLKNAADLLKLESRVHWVTRGDDERPGYVFADNAPSLEQEYKSSQRARAIHAEVETEKQPKRRERLVREGLGALRTSYEAFVIFEVFQEVVQRWGERISIGRLKDVIVDAQVCADVEAAHARLSGQIEAHLHPNESAQELSAKLLMGEIEAFDALKKRQKALKKIAKA